MAINRRRAPSSMISRQKKLDGHKKEQIYAELIGGTVIKGTQKGDVRDKNGELHSVKSGKKWQIFLYGYTRIIDSSYLNLLQPCLEAFPKNYTSYLKDRVKCIEYKEKYISENGREATKRLSNDYISKRLEPNNYIESKNRLKDATSSVYQELKDINNFKNFIEEAIFNTKEVTYLAILDSTYKQDYLFKVFHKKDVLDILSEKLSPSVSIAGRVAEDYNVPGQKIILTYKNSNGKDKNIVEIEIRNDSSKHYRQVRFNMYSKDTLYLLLNDYRTLSREFLNEQVVLYGSAIKNLQD